jgi:hypothetical protein
MQSSDPNSNAVATEDGYLKLNNKRAVKIYEKSFIYWIGSISDAIIMHSY